MNAEDTTLDAERLLDLLIAAGWNATLIHESPKSRLADWLEAAGELYAADCCRFESLPWGSKEYVLGARLYYDLRRAATRRLGYTAPRNYLRQEEHPLCN